MPTADAHITEGHLQSSVEAALHTIAQVRREREHAPIHAARLCLAEAHGAARLRKRLARDAPV